MSGPEQHAFVAAITRATAEITQVKHARIGRIVEFSQLPLRNGGHVTYSFAAIFEFDNKEGLAEYLAHPSHDLVRELFWKNCAATLIADVELDEVAAETAGKLVS